MTAATLDPSTAALILFGIFFTLMFGIALTMIAEARARPMIGFLEALNDIGASEFLGVRTLTVAVFPTDMMDRALYAGIRKLSDDLSEHIEIENNVLFKSCSS